MTRVYLVLAMLYCFIIITLDNRVPTPRERHEACAALYRSLDIYVVDFSELREPNPLYRSIKHD